MRINWFFINGYHKNEKEKKNHKKVVKHFIYLSLASKKKNTLLFSVFKMLKIKVEGRKMRSVTYISLYVYIGSYFPEL